MSLLWLQIWQHKVGVSMSTQLVIHTFAILRTCMHDSITTYEYAQTKLPLLPFSIREIMDLILLRTLPCTAI